MKKIVIVCHDSLMSGANMSLFDWATGIDKRKYKLCFVLPKKNKIMENKIISYGYDVIIGDFRLPIKLLYDKSFKTKCRAVLKYIYCKTINNLRVLQVSKKLKNFKPDIIHTNSFAATFGVQLAIKMKVPHIWHIREFMEEDHKITHFDKKSVDKYCEYSNAIYISDVIKEKYKSKFKKNALVLFNKINYNEEYSKERKLFDNEEVNLAIIGTLAENKGQLDAIKAQEILINKGYKTKLNIIGTGYNEEFLKNYVRDKKIKNVEFWGHQENVTELRKNLDIALVCSKNEALGRVTVEGMYYNNLVIGANAGCTKYIIENGYNGFLYETGNEGDLANKIIYAINNKSEVEKIIESAYKYAIDRFYKINYTEEICKIYDELIKNESKFSRK